MINFKEYLTENFGNLKIFSPRIAKYIIANSSGLYHPNSKVFKAKTKGIKIVKEFHNLFKKFGAGKSIIILNDGEELVYEQDDMNGDWVRVGWNGNNFEDVLTFPSLKAVYFIAQDEEAYLKMLHKPVQISKDFYKKGVSISSFKILYKTRLESVTNNLKKKFSDLQITKQRNGDYNVFSERGGFGVNISNESNLLPNNGNITILRAKNMLISLEQVKNKIIKDHYQE